MKARELFGQYRVGVDVDITEDCVKRITQLLLVDWKYSGQATDRKGFIFRRGDEIIFLTNRGDVTVDFVQPVDTYDTVELS